MTTVPKAGDPPPANNAKTTIVSDSKSGNYGRPTAGGNVAGGTPEGGSSNAPAGPTPGYAVNWSGAPVSTGGTQTGADIGSGATIIAGQPDATGHPAGDASGGGTVGDSGNQQLGPAPIPSVTGMPDIDNDGDAL